MAQTRAQARRNGNNKKGVNNLLLEDYPVHDWYRFVLSYPPHLVRDYLERFGCDSGQTVLDPFCGTGTTLVECKKRGIPSVGVEANPVAYFASRVKTNWDVSPDGLRHHAKQVAEHTNTILTKDNVVDDPLFLSFNVGQQGQYLKKLPLESEKLLLQNSISPLPLHKALRLLEQLEERRSAEYYDHERLALAKALTTSISNLHFGPEVGVGPAKVDAPVLAPWLECVTEMANDLKQFEKNRHVPVTVHLADARSLLRVVMPQSVDVVITSPPYPNEKDYTRITRLETVLLGFARNKQELQAFKRTLLRSNTRNVYSGDDDDQWVAHVPEIQHIADEIEARRLALNKTSGFERLYAKVTRLYFGGIARHLAALRSVLRPGARLAYVVGDQASYLRILIPTGQLVEQIAVNLGYEATGIDLFRTRLATATKEQLKEEVVTLRWTGKQSITP